MDYRAVKLLGAVAECVRHRRRMLGALKKNSPLFPLDARKYRILTDEEIEHIDQMIYRFTKRVQYKKVISHKRDYYGANKHQ